jgi:lambda repressor-like predicted transcriptional regulator
MRNFREFAGKNNIQEHVESIEKALEKLNYSMAELDSKYGYDTSILKNMLAGVNEHWQDKQKEIAEE